MVAIIIISIITVVIVTLLVTKDDALPSQSSPAITRRRKTETSVCKDAEAIGVTQNGDIFFDNGDLYVINEGHKIKLTQNAFVDDVTNGVMDKMSKMWTPTPSYFRGALIEPTMLSQNKFVAIGDVFVDGDIFCSEVKNKVRGFFTKTPDRIIYGQRCDVYPNGCVCAKNFTHIGGKNITDPMGKPIEKILLINDCGELVKKPLLPITYKESEKYDDLLYNTIGVKPTDKVYVVWTNGYRRKGGYCD